MALELAEDGRDRVRAERHAALRIPAIGGLDEPEPRDLHEVVKRLRRVAVPAREALGKAEMALVSAAVKQALAK